METRGDASPDADAEILSCLDALLSRVGVTDARLAINSLQPPPHLEALVREYFSSLAP